MSQKIGRRENREGDLAIQRNNQKNKLQIRTTEVSC